MTDLLTLDTAVRTLAFRHLSNDLFADLFCRVGGCLGLILLSGYNDSYFFDAGNAHNHLSQRCPRCGARFAYRWTRHGVLVGPPEAPDD